MTMIEAMATGLPVVAAKVGGIPDLAENNRALLYESGEHNAFVKALENIKSIDTDAAQKYATDTHSFDKLKSSLASLYDEVRQA